MQVGVNVPNYGPGTDPGVLRQWARVVEGLGYDILMMSDHIAITPDVAAHYPAPFYDPFTTLAWLAGTTSDVMLGTTVVVVPYRHPLAVARIAANLHELSGGRFVLGVGAGGARQEFQALGVPFDQRGRLTDSYLDTIRSAWQEDDGYRARSIPLWVGGNSEAAVGRAIRLDAAWHPLGSTWAELREVAARHPQLALAPRVALRLTPTPAAEEDRLLGVGTVEQIVDDLRRIRQLGADAVVLDPYDGDPEQTRRPHEAWQALTAIAPHLKEPP